MHENAVEERCTHRGGDWQTSRAAISLSELYRDHHVLLR